MSPAMSGEESTQGAGVTHRVEDTEPPSRAGAGPQ